MEKIVNLLKEKGLTISCAESLTGGSFAASITNVSGASKVFKGGIVTYTNEIKRDCLNVKEDTLNKFGAVSKECCFEMAQNVKSMFNSDIGVAFTGNAGPTASENKPVGLVYIGIYFLGDIEILEVNLKGTREEIRKECIRLVSNKILKKIQK